MGRGTSPPAEAGFEVLRRYRPTPLGVHDEWFEPAPELPMERMLDQNVGDAQATRVVDDRERRFGRDEHADAVGTSLGIDLIDKQG
ncbi:hypothetical protein O9X98_06805 [Agrobacterium salinitolerans]|nr:hypothetical protein [Agrobacterium salinitolerans]